MNLTNVQQLQKRVSFTRYTTSPPPRWRLIVPNFKSSMSTIPVCILFLLTGAGMMLSESQQFMLIGAVIVGSAFGSIFQVARALVTKTEEQVPRQVILYRFLAHSAGGTIFGVFACMIALYWFHIELPLVMLGVASGGVCGWLSEVIAKRYQPRIIEMLEKTGRIPKSPETELRREPPTKDLSPPRKEPASGTFRP